MAESLQTEFRPLLEAVAFAARAHKHQVRKDHQTPYVSHVLRVCLIVRHVFSIDDPQALMAAALHDTIEDTNTDFDDLEEKFGSEVASWVGILSKDKRMQDQEREQDYMAALATAPWQVKVCKLADIFDNLVDSAHTSPQQQARTIRRSHEYLEALRREELPDPARQPFAIVTRLLSEMETGANR